MFSLLFGAAEYFVEQAAETLFGQMSSGSGFVRNYKSVRR